MNGNELAMAGEYRSGHRWAAAIRRRGVVAARLVLVSYARPYFSRSPLTGALLMAATMTVPLRGLAGLAGLLLALAWARLLGLSSGLDGDDPTGTGSWLYGCNGLLVGLALGCLPLAPVRALVLLAVAELLTVLLAAALHALWQRLLGVPVLSLPFVLATWVLLAAARLHGVSAFAADTGWAVTGSVAGTSGPAAAGTWISLLLRSLAATFFQTDLLAGLLVLAGLLWWSRWSAVLACAGFSAGALTWLALGGSPSELHTHLLGFNFVLSAIAIGGTWLVLRPASLLLALAASVTSAVVAAALTALLQALALPVLAAPFLLVTQLVLLVSTLPARSARDGLQVVPGDPASPESNARGAAASSRSLIGAGVPLLFLPVLGRWQVTQGHHGEHTHQGAWAHAWDLEVVDEQGRAFRGSGLQPADYYAYGAPVVAPADGRVVRVVDHLPDNPIGGVDTTNNWGNQLVLWHTGNLYSALCHLQPGSTTVSPGNEIRAGQLLGRVGSSGRSPVPHLHFQLQVAAEMGSATCPCQLIHYLVAGCGGARYVTRGTPGQGDLITALTADERIGTAVGLDPGRCWHWDVQRGGDHSKEIWHSEIDPLGRRRLVATHGTNGATVSAEVPFYLDRHHLQLGDLSGEGGSLLALLSLGLPRLPFLATEAVSWTDEPGCHAILPRPGRLLHELALPWRTLSATRTLSRCRCSTDGRIEVTTRLTGGGAQLPDWIEVALSPEVGPQLLRAYRGSRRVVTARLMPS